MRQLLRTARKYSSILIPKMQFIRCNFVSYVPIPIIDRDYFEEFSLKIKWCGQPHAIVATK